MQYALIISDCVQPNQCTIHASFNSLPRTMNRFSSYLRTCGLFPYAFPARNTRGIVVSVCNLRTVLYWLAPHQAHPCAMHASLVSFPRTKILFSTGEKIC